MSAPERPPLSSGLPEFAGVEAPRPDAALRDRVLSLGDGIAAPTPEAPLPGGLRLMPWLLLIAGWLVALGVVNAVFATVATPSPDPTRDAPSAVERRGPLDQLPELQRRTLRGDGPRRRQGPLTDTPWLRLRNEALPRP